MQTSQPRREGSDGVRPGTVAVGGCAPVALPLLLLAARTALAAGIEHPDVGTLSIGRGGAYAAAPSDGLAMFYNPAGLADQRGFRVTLDASLSWQGLTFTPPGGQTVSNGEGGFLVPALAASYGLGPVRWLRGLTFALGATGPSAIGKESYPDAGPQRYALIKSDYFIAYYSGSVAAAFTRWLSAGVTFQLVQGRAEFSQAVWSGPGMDTEPVYDSLARVKVSSSLIPTAVFGVSARPTPPLALGLSYRPGFDFLAHGTLTTQPPEMLAGPLNIMIQGDQTDFFVAFPDVIRLGAQYQLGPRWLVEADIVAERWSRLHTIEIRPQGITLTSSGYPTARPLPTIVFQKDFEDAVSFRVGGDFVALPGRLTVRAGYLHETSAIPLRSVSVDFGNWQRDMVSLGGTVALWPGVTASVAYAHHFLADQNVTDSQVVQVISPCLATPDCTEPAPTVVGKGRYTGSLDVASLSLGLVLDDLRAARH
ncbi:MAG TPA: outer membrane protein transport protein [Polyangia bacterium]|nr:outer membrane protein transport protein [Polyangia bacterium]